MYNVLRRIRIYRAIISELITGANLTVRASKIISGQEPAKTNELLQAIGKALDKKVTILRPFLRSTNDYAITYKYKKNQRHDKVKNVLQIKQISSAQAIERYKKNLGKGKSGSRSKLSVAKDERKSSSKETSQKRASTSKERSIERKKKAVDEDNSTIREATRKNENQDSRKNVEAAEVPRVEVI